MSKKTKEVNYFKTFISSASSACEACSKLEELMQNLHSPIKIVQEIHEIENDADIKYHKLMEALNKAFITPIEREDIMRLAQAIDDVVDSIENIAVRFYMLNITNVRSEAMEFITLITKSCYSVKTALEELPNFKKSQKISSLLIKINDVEEQGDQLYRKAVRTLFDSTDTPIEIIKWREMFELMEHCCDACEDVADVIESVMMKNS